MLNEKARICSVEEPFVSLIYDPKIDALVGCTYSKNTQNRTGQICVLDKQTLKELYSVRLSSAAFHLEFSKDLYFTGLGDGNIAFFDAQTRKLSVETPQPFAGQMVTDAKLDTNCQKVAFTDEAGAVRVYERENSTVIFDRSNAHSLVGQAVNAWSCEFLDENLIASGGDDNFMRIWDLRDGGIRPVQTNKAHEGGIVRLIKFNDKLWTGSYDEKLRPFDLRALNEPLNCIEFGGGVWDFKFDELNKRIYVANMYNGFSILNLDTLEFLHKKEMPDQLIYGITATTDLSSIYCCSFTTGLVWHYSF